MQSCVARANAEEKPQSTEISIHSFCTMYSFLFAGWYKAKKGVNYTLVYILRVIQRK